MEFRFKDRREAGEELSGKLDKYRGKDAVVLALPRGGVPVAKVVSDRLGLLLDLLVVRKIGHPHNSEYAIGAISEGGLLIKNEAEVRSIDQSWFNTERRKEHNEARRRRKKYWGDRSLQKLEKKIAIIIDDGLATGLTMEVAIKEARERGAKKIVVGVPVAPADTALKMKGLADDFVVIFTETGFFGGVGAYYDYFGQVSDEEVVSYLK